jgi:hypothetical protein
MDFIAVLKKIKKGKAYKRDFWKDKYIRYAPSAGQIFTYTTIISGGLDLYYPNPTDLMADDWKETIY